MAEKLTDDELRKALIELGEVNIGAVTASTRPIYLKKLNHLRARQKQSSGARTAKSTGKKLLGFSSDESESDDVLVGPARSRWRAAASRQSPRRARSGQKAGKMADVLRPSKSDVSLTRPTLRGRQNSPAQAFDSDTGRSPRNSVDNSSLRRTVGINRTFNDSNNAFRPPYSSLDRSKATDSIGLQVSLADDSQGSDGDYELDGNIPDGFDSSDSDLDVHQVPDTALSDNSNTNPDGLLPGDRDGGSPSVRYGNRKMDPQISAMSYYGNKSPPTRTKSPNSFTRRTTTGNVTPVHNHVLMSKNTMPSVVPSYPFRVAYEKPSWKNSIEHHVSRFLVILFALFFLVIGVMYWNMRSLSSQDAEVDKSDWMLCNTSVSKTKCFTKDDIRHLTPLITDLGELLSRRAGQFECGYNSKKSMTMEEIEAALQMSDDEKRLLQDAMLLIQRNPHWMIRLLGSDGELAKSLTDVRVLESLSPSLSLWCRLGRALMKVFSILLILVIVALAICVGFAVLRWYWRLQEEEARNVYILVERIIDVLKSHYDDCQDNPDLKPYVAIPHVRDMLIPPKERRKKQTLWDKAVKFLSTNESRVRVEMITIEGEEFAVWRWLPSCPNGSKVWQGQAFGEHLDGGPRKSPTPCLKIRNMFDLDVEYGDDWHVYIQDAVLEKCGPDHNILHIAVDKTSREGCVYVKCKDEKSAGKAYKTLHGWWFDGNLLTVKYLHLERYHERFPESINCHVPLKPSNNKKLSLSQPFHHSVMETS